MSIPKQLESWFIENQRPLSFRINKDPYRVWISEIMAQQTQIDTMLPFYERWMNLYPTLQTLSEASENDLLKLWEGLGYYSRVRNIYKAIQIIKTNDYVFPHELEDIKALPGIGPYTAAAIASICFETKSIAIDGNVNRVVSRIFTIQDEQGSKPFQEIVTKEMDAWMSEATPSVFTQAMMELGALICTPKNPKCPQCPIQAQCRAYQNDQSLDYPIKKASKIKPILHKKILFARSVDHKIALTKDNSDQLMQGYWRFLEVVDIPKDAHYLGHLRHVFTHLIWELDFYLTDQPKQSDLMWFSAEEIEALPLITAHRLSYNKFRAKIFASES